MMIVCKKPSLGKGFLKVTPVSRGFKGHYELRDGLFDYYFILKQNVFHPHNWFKA